MSVANKQCTKRASRGFRIGGTDPYKPECDSLPPVLSYGFLHRDISGSSTDILGLRSALRFVRRSWPCLSICGTWPRNSQLAGRGCISLGPSAA